MDKKQKKILQIYVNTVIFIGIISSLCIYIYVWMKVNKEPVMFFGISFPWWLVMFIIMPIVLLVGTEIFFQICNRLYRIIKRITTRKNIQNIVDKL